ncbi:hypothetical protein ACLB2K_063858 [Fragaria x ananassa]
MDRDMYGQPRESSHVQQEAKPGVIGSVFRAEYTTLKAKETTDAAGEKLDEYKEAAAQSAKEAADRTAQKTMAMKDTTAQKWSSWSKWDGEVYPPEASCLEEDSSTRLQRFLLLWALQRKCKSVPRNHSVVGGE